MAGVIPNLTLVNQDGRASQLLPHDKTIIANELTNLALSRENDIRLPALTDEPTALGLFVVGAKYLDDKRYSEARKCFLSCLPAKGNNSFDRVPVLSLLGFTASMMADFPSAAKYYSDALATRSRDFDSLNGRGVAYLAMDMNKEALSDLDAALLVKPDAFPVYLNRGGARYFLGDYEGAIVDATKALTDKGCAEGAYLLRGLAYGRMSRYDEAITEFTVVLRLDPRSVQGYQNRGVAFLRKGMYDQAIADASRGLQFSPNDPKLILNRAIAWQRKGNNREAIDDLTHGLEQNPADVVLLAKRAEIHLSEKRHAEAIADYSAAIAATPHNAILYNNRGTIYMTEGQWEKAMADFDLGTREDADYPWLWANWGIACALRGDRVSALVHLRKALECSARLRENALDPNIPEDQQELALAGSPSHRLVSRNKPLTAVEERYMKEKVTELESTLGPRR